MKVRHTELAGVVIIEPRVFSDSRGYFMETFHARRYSEVGISDSFVQDNLSYSRRGTVRGLHFQHPNDHAKLLQVLTGEVFDVAVDVRLGSPSFGQWFGASLSAENNRQIYIPCGFAHGFCVISEIAIVAYKCTDFYDPPSESAIAWNDPDIGIDWPEVKPLLSDKDSMAPRLKDLDKSRLPRFDE